LSQPAKPTRLEIWSWCTYDFANSAYPTLIMTVAYAVYFREVVAGGARNADLLWGVSISASMILIGVVSPLVGAIADFSASKRKWLLFYTSLCLVPTALLFLVGPGDVPLGVTLFVIANIGFAGSLAVYNGFLPEISNERNVGSISGYGYGAGYVGGLVELLLCFPLMSGGFDGENQTSFRSAFVVTALFYAVFSLPTFLWFQERATAGQLREGESLLRVGYRRLSQTFHHVRSLRDLFRFLAAYIIYNDGIETVIYFSNIYAISVLGFSMQETIILFMAVQLTALLGSVVFGHLGDRFGLKPTLLFVMLLWSGVVTSAFLATSKERFWAIALVAGLGLGSAQASSRGLMRLFIPAGRDAEFYGFFAICQKFSAVIGPTVYGLVSLIFDDPRVAILSVLVFFVAGSLILFTVNVSRGRAAALQVRY